MPVGVSDKAEQRPVGGASDGAPSGPASGPKIALMFAAFGPYHAVRARVAGARQNVIGIEGSRQDEVHDWRSLGRTDGFRLVTLFNDAPIAEKETREVRKKVFAALSEHRPDVVAVPGWSENYAHAMLAWAHANGVPAIMMSDSQERDFPRFPWREWIKGRILKTCSAALVAGRRHVEYLERLGMPRARTFTGYDVVDNAHFADGAARARAADAAKRTELALPAQYFLASARFVPKKNLAALIDAYARYRHAAGAGAWSLVILGGGPLAPALDAQVAALQLQGAVLMPGYKQYEELPAYYGLASAFVHLSSTEQWGLVVNEAMAAGLPVIVSDRCGCAPDLVEDGANGFVVDPDDQAGVADAMTRIAAPGFDRAAMAARGRAIIAEWGPEAFAEGLHRAARTALDTPVGANVVGMALLWLIARLK